MKLLVLSDIHGNTSELSRLTETAKSADALVVNGDLTHFGGRNDALRVIGELKRLHDRIYAVPGNCDNEEVASIIEAEGIGIEGKPVEALSVEAGSNESRPLVKLYGIGGALPGPVSTPNEYSEEDLQEKLSRVPGAGENQGQPQGEVDVSNLLLVCHQPPHKTIADRAMKVKHVGSRVLRQWMDEYQPLLLLTGHIHESAGWDCYGQTCVLNPGSFKEGKYAEVDIDFAEGGGDAAPAETRPRVEVKLLSV